MFRRTYARHLRSSLFALLLGVQLLTLLLTTVVWQSSTNRVLRSRMSSDLGRTAREASERVARHLTGPVQLRNALVNYVPQIGVTDDAAIEKLFVASVQTSPEVSGVLIGRKDGSFLFASRAAEGIFVKRITVGPEGRKATRSEHWGDAKTIDLPDDTYDPRARPWYQLARANGVSAWTDVYQFATSKLPGITTAAVAPDRASGVVIGVDVELDLVEDFLAQVKVGETGVAFVLDKDGLPVGQAASNPMVQAISAKHRTGNPDFRQTIDGTKMVAAFVPVTDSPSWSVGVLAPEREFLHDQGSLRRQLLGAFGLLALVSLALGFAVTRLMRSRVDELAKSATVDSLTGLLNRGKAMDLAQRRLTRQRRDGLPTFLCMFDVDHFKAINDTYGHGEGDVVLQAVANRLVAALRPDDVVGRYGGEEFVVVLDRIANPAEAQALMERVRLSISESVVRIGDAFVSVTLSGGLALSAPSSRHHNVNVREIDALAMDADEALYLAKNDGRNRMVSHRSMSADLTPTNTAQSADMADMADIADAADAVAGA
jgi:diguanylate cyclase (GGDEF)-like protein